MAKTKFRMVVASPLVKHLCHCVLFLSLVLTFMWSIGAVRLTQWDPRYEHLNPWQDYGPLNYLILCLARIVALLAVPQQLFNFIGLLRYNAFPKAVTLKGSPLLAPLICFRVVTRGDFPDLVKTNVARNIRTCIETGLENFVVEVATDKAVGMPENRRVREVVIPREYKTRTGAMFKARALQYCLEEGVNVLSDQEWVVHLDEETILTPNALRGIVNFVLEGRHDFGQGLITYANDGVVNWITTLADSVRVADDMGKLRLQFKAFHQPLFSFKGSYVVARVAAERAISFDNGIDGSIAEDCFFALMAASRGYSFDFVDGELHEKSPFTLLDFIQQRKRWLQGLLLVVHSPQIPWQTKIFLAFSVYSTVTLPLSTSNLFLALLYPIACPLWLDIILSFTGAVGFYMYLFGVIKSFPRQRLGWPRYLLCCVAVLCLIPVFAVLENAAVLWGLVGKKHKFHVVQKGIIIKSLPVMGV